MRSKAERRAMRWKHPVRDIVLLVVGLFVVGVAYVVLWAYTAKSATTIDYTTEVAELVRSRQPAVGGAGAGGGVESEANAWLLLKEAIAAYETALAPILSPTPGGGINVIDWDLLRDGYQQEVDEYPAGDEVLRAAYFVGLDARRADAEAGIPVIAASPLSGVLERMVSASGGERTGYASPLIGVLLPELGGARQMSRYLAARMRVAGATGDSATVLACFEQMLAVARVLAHQAFVIDRLVAFAIAKWALVEVRLYAESGSMNADDARAALAMMDRQLAWPGLDLPLEGDRLMGHDLIQHVHSSGGLIPGRLLETELNGMTIGRMGPSLGALSPLRNLTGLFLPSKAQTTIALDGVYDAMIANAAMAREERERHPFSPDEFIAALGPQPVLKAIMPALQTVMDAADAHDAEVLATRERLEGLGVGARAGGESPGALSGEPTPDTGP